MKVLVTGGAGYIGSVVTEYLTRAGHEVVVVDNLSTGHRAAIDDRVDFYEGDLQDEGFLLPILGDGVEAVCHFAAFSQVPESVVNPIKYYRNNINGAVSLVSAMKAAAVRNFLFSSTAAVYGDPDRTPIEEEDPLQPVNAYGNTKLAVEKLLSDCSGAWGLRSVSLRYFNAAGASEVHGEDHRPETHLIPIAIDAALGRREELIVFGDDYPTPDGTCVRDYIHVKDLAAAHILALEKLLDGFTGALNLGNGQGFSVMEVIESVSGVTGLDVPHRIGGRRAGDPAVLVASSEKAESLLGWERVHADLGGIIGDAYEWRKEYPEGYPE